MSQYHLLQSTVERSMPFTTSSIERSGAISGWTPAHHTAAHHTLTAGHAACVVASTSLPSSGCHRHISRVTLPLFTSPPSPLPPPPLSTHSLYLWFGPPLRMRRFRGKFSPAHRTRRASLPAPPCLFPRCPLVSSLSAPSAPSCPTDNLFPQDSGPSTLISMCPLAARDCYLSLTARCLLFIDTRTCCSLWRVFGLSYRTLPSIHVLCLCLPAKE